MYVLLHDNGVRDSEHNNDSIFIKFITKMNRGKLLASLGREKYILSLQKTAAEGKM